jgi:ketosteroid isomerase-like protein
MDEEAAVQRALAAWNEGIDAFIEVLAPDVEWHAPPGFPEGEVWYGHEAVAGILREVWKSVFRGQGVRPDQIARGREAWMLGGRQTVLHESGMTLEWEEFVVFQLEEGLIRRAWIFMDRETAARQAGLAD